MSAVKKRVVIGINSDFRSGACSVGYNYVRCVAKAGAVPAVIPCLHGARPAAEYMRLADGLLLIGGGDYPAGLYGEHPHARADEVHPRRAGWDLCLARAALACRKPLLGICGGHQLIHIAMGGRIIQHLEDAACHRKEGMYLEHSIIISGGKILRQLFGKGKVAVNSNHHQAVDPRALPEGLEAVAHAGGVVEAIEAPAMPFVLGVQWHPERMAWSGHAALVFGAFVAAAGRASWEN